MAESLIDALFPTGNELDPQGKYNLTRRARNKRMREILHIVRKHHVLRGFTPRSFRELLEDLGPTFVKVGQMLSMRSEILPLPYRQELRKLQADVDPMSFADVEGALSYYYGENWRDYIEGIDPTPLGSASIAQVHRATLKNGESVAVKVQRPGVQRMMALDIDIMRSLVHRFTRFIRPYDQMIDLQSVVEEFWDTFVEETDFRKEAANLIEFKNVNASCTFVDCPKVFPKLSGEHVLVMEYIDGISIIDREALEAAGYDPHEIAAKLLDNYSAQVIDYGFFHADPHPGNIVVRDGVIVYLDLGMVGRLSQRERAAFGDIVSGVGFKDSEKLKDALLRFAVERNLSEIDHGKLLADLDLIIADYASVDIESLDIGQMLTDVIQLARNNHIKVPASITSVARGIITLEGTVDRFVQNMNMVQIITDHIKSSTEPAETIKDELADLIRALRNASEGSLEAAQYAGETMRMLSRGQLKANMELVGDNTPVLKAAMGFNHMAVGVIIAGLFIGSSLLSLSNMEPRFLGIPILALAGYVSAAIMALWLLVQIVRMNRQIRQ